MLARRMKAYIVSGRREAHDLNKREPRRQTFGMPTSMPDVGQQRTVWLPISERWQRDMSGPFSRTARPR